MQNTEPSMVVSGESVVHDSQSMPMEDRAPALSPSVMPMVSHESNSADAETAMKAGLTPPVLAPKGVASW
jgi:hypothetical protein